MSFFVKKSLWIDFFRYQIFYQLYRYQVKENSCQSAIFFQECNYNFHAELHIKANRSQQEYFLKWTYRLTVPFKTSHHFFLMYSNKNSFSSSVSFLSEIRALTRVFISGIVYPDTDGLEICADLAFSVSPFSSASLFNLSYR